MGKWTQQDTLDTPLAAANANRYAYAGDDPVNQLDPQGRSFLNTYCAVLCPLTKAIGAAGGALGLGGTVASTTGVGAAAGVPAAIIGGPLGFAAQVQDQYNDIICAAA